MRRYLVGGLFIALFTIGSIFAFRKPVLAEDSASGDQSPTPTLYTDSSSEHQYTEQEQEIEDEDRRYDEEVKMEDSLDEHLNSISFDVSATVPEFSPSDLQTYGDVVKALEVYNAALDQYIAQAAVTSTVTGLTDQELALLNNILGKHERPFNQTEARAKEIKTQIAAISAALQPLADLPISPLLKKTIVSALNDLKDEIRNLGGLEHYGFDILNAELSN